MGWDQPTKRSLGVWGYAQDFWGGQGWRVESRKEHIGGGDWEPLNSETESSIYFICYLLST